MEELSPEQKFLATVLTRVDLNARVENTGGDCMGRKRRRDVLWRTKYGVNVFANKLITTQECIPESERRTL